MAYEIAVQVTMRYLCLNPQGSPALIGHSMSQYNEEEGAYHGRQPCYHRVLPQFNAINSDGMVDLKALRE